MILSSFGFKPQWLLLSGLTPLCCFAAAEAQGPTLIDFESLAVGELADSSGFKVNEGRALVVGDYAHTGKNSLSLASGAAETSVQLPWNPVAAKTAIVRFWVNGVPAADRAESREFANASGAMVALVKDKSGQGRIWVLDVSGDSPAWRKTDAVLPLSAEGATQGWTSLEFQIDYTKARWALVIDGTPATSGAGLLTDEKLGRRNFLYGFADKSWAVDDCAFQPDADLSLGASVAKGNLAGYSSADKVAAFAAGLPSVVDVSSGKSSARSAESNTPVGELKVVHVSAATGNDANAGSEAHPKATIRAAFATLSQAGGEVFVSDGCYNLPFRRFPGVKIITNGCVEFK